MARHSLSSSRSPDHVVEPDSTGIEWLLHAADGLLCAVHGVAVDAAQRTGPVLGYAASARQPNTRASGRNRAARPELQGRACQDGRTFRATGELRCSRACCPRRRRDRPEATAVCDRRPARRSRPGIGGFKADSESASPSRPAIPATSSVFFPNRCPVRPSRTSRLPKHDSSRR